MLQCTGFFGSSEQNAASSGLLTVSSKATPARSSCANFMMLMMVYMTSKVAIQVWKQD
jgi:hypothetical protein